MKLKDVFVKKWLNCSIPLKDLRLNYFISCKTDFLTEIVTVMKELKNNNDKIKMLHLFLSNKRLVQIIVHDGRPLDEFIDVFKDIGIYSFVPENILTINYIALRAKTIATSWPVKNFLYKFIIAVICQKDLLIDGFIMSMIGNNFDSWKKEVPKFKLFFVEALYSLRR